MTQWQSFMLLFMGLFCKVSMKENMTQVFFFVVENDLLVKDVVKNLISSLSINVDNLTISNATISTECEWKNDDTKKCWCMKTYSWSSDACVSHKCCNAEACTLQHKDKIMCVKDDRVTINGSTTFPYYTYNRLFNTNNEKTEEYDTLNELMTNELKNKFSKIPWFYTLVITGFRSGSVIADYTVQFHGAIKTDQLMEITNSLNDTKLVTKGLVTMKAPKEQPVGIGSNLEFSCTKHGNVKWVLFNARNETLAITHGTQAQLNSTNDVDTLKLTNISASWKGLFTCEYTVGPIKHIASEMLDIAILADISARSQPQFPDCTVPGTKKEVTIQCSTPVSKENYNVSWSSSDLKDLRSDVKETKGDLIIYKAIATIKCEESSPESVTVTCTFTNDRPKVYGDRKSSTRTLQIPIIRRDSKTCPMDTDWPKSKSNYTAVLDCDSQTVGEKTRKCTETGWEAETSSCVKVDLQLIHNEIKEMAKGLGYITENADRIVEKLKTITTTDRTVNSYANIDISVDILKEINDVSVQQSHKWNDTIMPNFVSTISNILNDTQTWNQRREASDLSVQYLQTVESMVKNSNLSTANHSRANVQLLSCNTSNCETTNASVTTQKNVVIVTFNNLADILPQKCDDNKSVDFKTLILLVTPVNGSSPKVNSSSSLSMNFKGMQMSRNHEMYCVYWNESGKFWSSKGCEWGGASNPDNCKCTHNSAFTIMMSKEPITLPYMETLTYICLGVSIVSLVLCILIEFLVWDKVVKSNIASFRHIALVNIAAWLLFAYCAFLATTEPKKTNSNWCLILTVVKHYCFLAVFFWTLCLSFVLLHQLIFIFEQLRKKIYITLSIGLGYVCPLLCVASAYVHFDNGEVGKYYSNETCWLTYESGLKGSIFAFIFPVGTIVIINMFALFVVITKIVTPAVSEVKARDEKAVAKSIIKTIVFLSPILGITWILGFLVFMLDLTQRPYAQIVNYAFTILNSLQGFFILLTNCFGEKKVREALSKRFGGKPSVHSKSDSSTKMTSVIKKK